MALANASSVKIFINVCIINLKGEWIIFNLFFKTNEKYTKIELPVRLILTILPHDIENNVVTCIDVIGYYEYGRFLDKTKDRRLIDNIRKGLNSLIESEKISCMESIKDSYVLDGDTCKCDTSKGNFMIIHLDELHKIMKTNNFGLLEYFCNLISTVNGDTKSWHMSQKDMCECWDMNFVTIDNYNKMLEELKLIYVHRPNVRKKDGTFHKVNNSYGRYKDKHFIIADANAYMTSTDEEYYSTKSKMDGNARTSIKMRYNGFNSGAKKYDNNPKAIEELYVDCISYNESIYKDNLYEPELLDLSIFDDCIDKNTNKFMIDGVSDDGNKKNEDTKCLPVNIEANISGDDEIEDEYYEDNDTDNTERDRLIDIESLFENEYCKSVEKRNNDWDNW